MLKNINFTICIIDNGSQFTTITCFPTEYRCLSAMFTLYKGRERMQHLIDKIKEYRLNKELSEDLGENVHSFFVDGEYTKYRFTSEIMEPVILETQLVIDVYEEYLKWYDRYENCELPGVIPKSKLDTWSCVPNEYIKDEYWEMMKKNKP